MVWIYLSPHLDDVALSVGGLVWEQSQSGQDVRIWTICAGDPPPGKLSPFAQSLHERWKVGRDAMIERRQEDGESCDQLGASYDHFEIPDCIYRRSDKTGKHLYTDGDSLWIPIHPDENILIERISELLREKLAVLPPEVSLVSPLAIGDHVDHRLTRAVAEKSGLPLLFYADYPYVVRHGSLGPGAKMASRCFVISPDGLRAWQAGIAAHRSQISTFWTDLVEMQVAIRSYYQQMGGIWLGGIDRLLSLDDDYGLVVEGSENT